MQLRATQTIQNPAENTFKRLTGSVIQLFEQLASYTVPKAEEVTLNIKYT